MLGDCDFKLVLQESRQYMGFQLNKIENGVLYVSSTPGNSFDGIKEFVQLLDLKIADEEIAGSSISILWDGREGTYNGRIDELIDIADLAAETLPAVRIAVVVASDQTRSLVEALKTFLESRGIEMLVTSSFKTANNWITN